MQHYVLATPPQLKGKMNPAYPRLYAHPSEPEPEVLKQAPLVIFDSGAYGLSLQGRRIDAPYMAKLNEHYQRFEASNKLPHVAIAPDVYLDPIATLENFAKWRNAGYTPVCPVIQFAKLHEIDNEFVEYQCSVYRQMRAEFEFIAISNPGLTGKMARAGGMGLAVSTVRKWFPDVWLHILGAGWSPADINDWHSISGITSIDSIAYYTAAQEGETWHSQPITKKGWTHTAIANANYVQTELVN